VKEHFEPQSQPVFDADALLDSGMEEELIACLRARDDDSPDAFPSESSTALESATPASLPATSTALESATPTASIAATPVGIFTGLAPAACTDDLDLSMQSTIDLTEPAPVAIAPCPAAAVMSASLPRAESAPVAVASCPAAAVMSASLPTSMTSPRATSRHVVFAEPLVTERPSVLRRADTVAAISHRLAPPGQTSPSASHDVAPPMVGMPPIAPTPAGTSPAVAHIQPSLSHHTSPIASHGLAPQPPLSIMPTINAPSAVQLAPPAVMQCAPGFPGSQSIAPSSVSAQFAAALPAQSAGSQSAVPSSAFAADGFSAQSVPGSQSIAATQFAPYAAAGFSAQSVAAACFSAQSVPGSQCAAAGSSAQSATAAAGFSVQSVPGSQSVAAISDRSAAAGSSAQSATGSSSSVTGSTGPAPSATGNSQHSAPSSSIAPLAPAAAAVTTCDPLVAATYGVAAKAAAPASAPADVPVNSTTQRIFNATRPTATHITNVVSVFVCPICARFYMSQFLATYTPCFDPTLARAMHLLGGVASVAPLP
jgi:hypothetical protein